MVVAERELVGEIEEAEARGIAERQGLLARKASNN